MTNRVMHFGTSWGSASYTAQGVHFDNATRLTHSGALTGVADSASLLFSMWLRLGDAGNSIYILLNALGTPLIRRLGDNTIQFYASDASYAVGYNGTTSDTYTSGWHHFVGSGNGSVGRLYKDDVNETNSIIVGSTPSYFSNAVNDWYIGYPQLTPYPFDIADFYYAPGQYLDLSVTENRRKFIDGSGRPVDLGADGSTPTGTAPAIFFSGEVASWATNKGSGGSFAAQGGTLTAASDNP